MAVATIRAFTLQSGLFPVPTSGLEPQLVQSALPIGRDTETVPPLLDWAGGRSGAEDRSWSPPSGWRLLRARVILPHTLLAPGALG